MVRQILGRLLGYCGEIECLQERVTALSWYEPFGMLTRNAFLQHCRELPPSGRRIIFIDLGDIGNLNNRYGYVEVDRRVKLIFTNFQIPGVTIARWYSGDEIVMLFDDLRDPGYWITKLNRIAQQYDISYVYETGVWEVAEQTIEEVIRELSSRVCKR
jgi:hypothetical protein